jgi:glutamate synthase domain-containing protein 3
MAELGFRTMDEMIGRSDRLETKAAIDHWKAHGVDLSALLHRPTVDASVPLRAVEKQVHAIDKVMDRDLIQRSKAALEERKPVAIELPIRNANLTTGTMLGAEISRRYGMEGLPDNTIQVRFHGTAGQSFGAFVPKGVTLTLEGDANDYLGKGLCGGRLIVYPPAGTTFKPEENIIVGNVVLYGATAGEAFFNGTAGERFCVRNSGAHTVVEGVGDHGCEYMTGGIVVILGETGRNFAAGMSGGIAYVLDEQANFRTRCNQAMVELEALGKDDVQRIRDLVTRHVHFTKSPKGQRVLDQWDTLIQKFVKIMPIDYKRILMSTQQEKREIA